MAHGLVTRGVGVAFATLSAPPPPWLAEPSLTEVRYSSLGAPTRRHYARATMRLARLLRSWRIDVLHTHLFDGAVVGIAAGRAARVPLVIVGRHHLDQHQQLRRPLHVRVDRLGAFLADGVIVPSEAVREHMVREEGIGPSRIAVIPHGLDREAFVAPPGSGTRIREEFGLAEAFVIGSVGRLVPAKGLDTLLAAAEIVARNIPEVRVLVVGDHPDPRHRRALVEKSERLGLASVVRLAGRRSDVAACMQAMDVLVHPPRTEAFGQVLIEAMAVGTPVIATAVGGIPEIVEPGKTGTLVPASDAVALAAAVVELYEHPELRDLYGSAGTARVQERFDADQMVERHLRRYSSGLGAKADASGGRHC